MFGGALAGSISTSFGLRNFVSSSRPCPSGVRIITMSTWTPSSPLTRSTHSPSTAALPSSFKPRGDTEYDADNGVTVDGEFFLEKLNPGTRKTGVIVFDVPANISPAKYSLQVFGNGTGESKLIRLWGAAHVSVTKARTSRACSSTVVGPNCEPEMLKRSHPALQDRSPLRAERRRLLVCDDGEEACLGPMDNSCNELAVNSHHLKALPWDTFYVVEK